MPNTSTKMSRFGSRMMSAGTEAIRSSISSVVPQRNMYRRRYRTRGDE